MPITCFRKCCFLSIVVIALTAPMAYAGNFGNPIVIPKEPSIGIGPEYDLTTRLLKIEDKGDAALLANRILVDMAANPIGFIRLKVKAGIGNINLSNFDLDKVKKISSSDVNADEMKFHDLSTPFNFAGGGGLDIAFMKDPKKYIGIGITGHALYQTGKKDETTVSFVEYGGAFILALISNGMIVPYAGFEYSGESGSIKVKPSNGKSTSLSLSNNPDYPVGILAGLNLVIGDNVRLEFEGRFLNELSGGLGILYVF